MSDDILKRMELQSKEFAAANEFSKALKNHNQVAVIDDDYPEVRHRYEGALAELLKAMKDNGRFVKSNRYGLTAV